MRLVQVLVPTGKRETVLRTLDEEGVDYAVSDESSGRDFVAVVTFPVPKEAVEPVLQRLRDAGIERDAYTVVVNAETVASKRFDALVEKYENDEENGDRIAREELASKAADLAPSLPTYVVMTAISAIVATAGLLLNSPAVVVGSMVIAPLVGPAMAASVGTVVDDDEMFVRGVRLQALGGVLAVGAAALFAFLLKETGAVPLSVGEVLSIPEVDERLAPDILSLAIALGAGAAGAISLSSGVSTALVGVMIAAALVPPTAVVGIGLAWGAPEAVVGSAILVLVNILSVNFVAIGVLWKQGYRPERWIRRSEARRTTIIRIAALGMGLLVLSSFLGAVTYTTYRNAGFQTDAQEAIEDVLADTDARLLALDVRYDSGPLQEPEAVVVTIGHDPWTDPPDVQSVLTERVNEVAPDPLSPWAADEVHVEVRYVAVSE
ncbi:TIGR00341 family protein [Haloferax sp. MBLA0076]|uniref:TIGR00341 family protein n=1 Tax=Haloferax litoreum TaxID=2666140 RepID=A0A6A8GFS8_9EURY|nr:MULTISPECIES: TIGR00341 family protein [Haloferax]KAB1193146.1 TIGR00341 family protein [Haloferax sp. CBA1148]MRX21641.1 TIGR00341 family protein [Haloferax litoreum]